MLLLLYAVLLWWTLVCAAALLLSAAPLCAARLDSVPPALLRAPSAACVGGACREEANATNQRAAHARRVARAGSQKRRSNSV